jgi:CRISPR type III-B/RAMP module-associated protein Cmr5
MHRDQLRARNAFGFVTALTRRAGDNGRDAFLGLARQLPVMLQVNGLLATWAHLLAKRGSEFREVASALTAHLQSLGLADPGTPDQVFSAWLQDPSAMNLRRRTSEAQVYSVWIKRAAEALCDGTPETGAAP